MSDTYYVQSTIRRKRDGFALSTAEIQGFVSAVVERRISDAQIAAFLMAVFVRGLSMVELNALTEAMRSSGETFDSSPLQTFTVDKHSTGGVGDKTSLLIAPIIAAAGLRNAPSISIPMISGRSLGHAGGTLDKLETIPGFRTHLSLSEIAEILETTHAVLAGQTPALVPADRILYGLRDHTGTVESPFLICASIMSKKLAAGLNALVLDVKTGCGAFLRTYKDSKFLAELMVRTGEAAGTRTVAILTSMDQPLGRFAGNWVEVQECVEVLQGRPHPLSADLVDLSLQLSGQMLHLAGAAPSVEAGVHLAADLVNSGEAYRSWLQIIKAQGGDISVFADAAAHHRPGATTVVRATHTGYLSGMDCTEVGWAVQRLGAGRTRPGDPVNADAGIEMHAKLGERVRAGQPLVTLFASAEHLLVEPARMLHDTFRISPLSSASTPLVREIVSLESLASEAWAEMEGLQQ